MKKTLILEFTRKEKQTVEVEFPIYRAHDVGGDSYSSYIYTRVEEDGANFSVHHNEYPNESFELEIRRYALGGNNVDYALGRGEYACTREKFEETVEKAKAFLGRF